MLFVKCNVMSEWFVLKPGKMSALEVVDIKLTLIKKKSRWHCISGFRLLQVKRFVLHFENANCLLDLRSQPYTSLFARIFNVLWGSHRFCLFAHLKLDFNHHPKLFLRIQK